MRSILKSLFVLALVAACSGKGEVVLVDAGNDAKTVADGRGTPDVPTEPEDARAELPPVETDVVELRFEETVPETVGPQCLPGEGCFLDKCDENGDCQAGWCVEHMGEGVCTQLCQEECPPGWVCKQVGAGGPDMAWACVSNVANLCKPCTTTEGCKSPGGAQDVCVDYGTEGSFCGGACLSNEECPWGFSCGEAVSVDGVTSKQCVSETGSCPCSDKSVKLGLSTPCEVTNEFGTCTGKRVCADLGLTECDAAAPSIEICNGVDDDCDGDVDEPTEVGGDYVNLCDDGNECTQDICNGESGCDLVALDGGECKDGNPCTAADHCEAGVCIGDPVVCEDGNPCTDDLCTENGGCAHEPNYLPCDDGDPCTLGDQCGDGECTGVAVPCDCMDDDDCDALEDGNLCNGTLYCDQAALPYQCKLDPETVVVCPEPTGQDAPCLAAACAPATGACSLVPAHEGWACDDGSLCTLPDKCVDGACVPGPEANCNDGNPCTDDSCVPKSGCAHTANALPCSDNDACTLGDQCADGACKAGAELLDCDDGNPCTIDSCNPAVGCAHGNSNEKCDDGNLCTEGDQCGGGQCNPGVPVVCDDENLCTTDSCAPDKGCVFTANTSPCSDGDVCTLNDQCKDGECVSSGVLDCDDGNPCTIDSCNPAEGCAHGNSNENCDDGNLCTLNDQCVDGKCKPGPAINCDDDNPCTTDTCVPEKGCTFALNDHACSDDDLCTTGDHCHLGSCISSGQLACNDSNPCTDDSCDPKTGCQFVPNAAACDDGNPCTLGDQCSEGGCLAGAALECPAGWSCVDGGCVLICPEGLTNCNDECVNLKTDSQHCGGCPKACGVGEYCADGACAPSCKPPLSLCGDECTNLNWDPMNCKECGIECQPGPHAAVTWCAQGTCGFICDADFADCNKQPGDGCESYLPTDSQNCGGCDVVCETPAHASGSSCADGDCVFQCLAGYDDCNGIAGDGCEVDLLTDSSHCGSCDSPCAEGEKCDGGDCVPTVVAATCNDILTTMNMWGMSSKGVDLRKYTNSTLHYLGCPGDGCDPGQFYCTYDANSQTLAFGSTAEEIRSVVDPNNANGDTMPNSYNGCCNGPLGLCNGPDANNNGVAVDNAKALCSALGYKNGILKRWQTSNTCPEAHALTADGLSWSSDWNNSSGYGAEWQCVGFK